MTKTISNSQTGRATSADVAIAALNATVALPSEQGCEAACHSNQQPPNDCEVTIRALAHHKWKTAGCPAGDGIDFWLEAEREVYAERSGSSSAHTPGIES